MVLEGGKFKIFSALRADEKRRSAPGILPPPRKNPGYAPVHIYITINVYDSVIRYGVQKKSSTR